MARVVISELADTDAADIMATLAAEAGVGVAARYNDAFDSIYRRLETFPEIGSRRVKLGKQTRVCLVLPYLVLYDYVAAEDVVTILRILHGRRNITRGVLMRRP